MWAKHFLQPRLLFERIPRGVAGMGETLSAAQIGFTQIPREVCLAWAQPFLQPRLVFTGIPRGVLGVGETLSQEFPDL